MNFVAHYDFNRYTTLEVHRTEKHVHHIPLDIVGGLHLQKSPIAKFDLDYKPIPGYCPLMAVAHFKRMGEQYGALKEVCEVLGIERVAKVIEEPVATKAVEKPKAAPKTKKITQGAMFMDLIMMGKFTDDEIFAKVQLAFDLTPDKKSYVNWYRKHLIKAGKNPPQPLGETTCNEKKRTVTTATSTPRSSKKPATAKPSTATTPRTSGAGASLAVSSPLKTTSLKSAAAKIDHSVKSSRVVRQPMLIPTLDSTSISSKKAKASGSASSVSSTLPKTGKSSTRK